jgi:hypothetical protein
MDPDRNMAASAAAHRGDLALLRKMPDQLTDLPHSSKPPGPEGGPAPCSLARRDLPPDGHGRPQ